MTTQTVDKVIDEGSLAARTARGAVPVTEFGAVGDGQTLNTRVLQGAIDRMAQAGGGTLAFPAGRFLTGSLDLRDRIHLHFLCGSVLVGSPRIEDYRLIDPPRVRFFEDAEGVRYLLGAQGCGDITLDGPGTLDGQGAAFASYPEIRAGRPRLIWLSECRDVRVEGLRLRDSAFWVQHYVHCTNLRLRGLDVFSHSSCNNDGLDIDGCSDVVVSDCTIDSHDDAICLKANNLRATEDVVITNCVTRSHCNHFKTGTESNGGFRNIVVSNLQMSPSRVLEADGVTQGADYRGACGIALGCVDGGNLENILVSNVQMDQVRVPFFVRMGNRARPVNGSTVRQPQGHAAGIRLSNIVARETGGAGCHVMGLPDSPVCHVTVENCEFHSAAAGTVELAEHPVPLNEEAYPACDAFGHLPAYGIFLRDVNGARISQVVFRGDCGEERPALRWQRVNGIVLDRVEDLRT